MTIRISYVSDVLCIWAYVAEARVDQLRKEYGDLVELEYRFIPPFGANRYRIGEGWKDRGGYAGYGEHVQKIASDFDHVSVNARVWSEVAPTTSGVAHEMLCAARLLLEEGVLDPARHDNLGGRTLFEEAIWKVRAAFFQQARDTSRREVVLDVLHRAGLPTSQIEEKLESGEAMAEVCRDIELRDQLKIEGSPTYYLNQGRQKLYGNVGYRVISANLRELLERSGNQASWC
ncbi:MAG: DsbA family protein [Myxococcales bacterium]|jgi:predicted DsbA family dithiol-disulfide isomerase